MLLDNSHEARARYLLRVRGFPGFVIPTLDRIVGFVHRQIEKRQPPLGRRQEPDLGSPSRKRPAVHPRLRIAARNLAPSTLFANRAFIFRLPCRSEAKEIGLLRRSTGAATPVSQSRPPAH